MVHLLLLIHLLCIQFGENMISVLQLKALSFFIFWFYLYVQIELNFTDDSISELDAFFYNFPIIIQSFEDNSNICQNYQ